MKKLLIYKINDNTEIKNNISYLLKEVMSKHRVWISVFFFNKHTASWESAGVPYNILFILQFNLNITLTIFFFFANKTLLI